VLDLADAVMLSGETAVGQYPVETVRMMNGIVRQVQAYHDECSRPMPVADAGSTTAAVAGAVRALLEAKDIRAVAVFTATGATARLLAKNRLCRSILAMSPDAAAVRRMCLYYGVQPRQTEAPEHTREVLKLAEQELRKLHLAERGDRIVVVSGRPIGRPGRTNTLVVHRIGDTQD
jgi:pyruvate kinase